MTGINLIRFFFTSTKKKLVYHTFIYFKHILLYFISVKLGALKSFLSYLCRLYN